MNKRVKNKTTKTAKSKLTLWTILTVFLLFVFSPLLTEIKSTYDSNATHSGIVYAASDGANNQNQKKEEEKGEEATKGAGDAKEKKEETTEEPNTLNSLEQIFFDILTAVGLAIMNFFGSILVMFIEILIAVFSFTQFIDTPAVDIGWVVIRDISNIGIVIALMIIAFSMVFNVKKYASAQLLVRLVIAAVLVNFSLLIAGLIVDLGQVIMMTFVNAFKDLIAGSLVTGFGIEKLVSLAKGDGVASYVTDTGASAMLGAILLGIIMLIVACAVILAFIAVMLQRIMYIWMLVIFSPAAFVAPLLPGGDAWIAQWRSKFFDQVAIGPILAFGFWLSMRVLTQVSANQSVIALSIQGTDNDNAKVARFLSEAAAPQAIFDFMVTVALLIGTLILAQKAGGIAGQFAGNISNKLKNTGMKALKKTVKYGGLAAVGGAAFGGFGLALTAPMIRNQMRKIGAGKGLAATLIKKGGKKLGNKMPRTGGFIEAAGSGKIPVFSEFAKDRQFARDKERQRGVTRLAGKLGIGENSAEMLSKVPILSYMPGLGKTNTGIALSKIASDRINAKRSADIINAGTRDGATAEEIAAAKSEVEAMLKSNTFTADGASNRTKLLMEKLKNNDNLSGMFTEVVNDTSRGIGKSKITNMQKALLSIEKSGQGSSVVTSVKEGIDASNDGVREFSSDEIPESAIRYSQAPATAEQKLIADYEAFSKRPEHEGKSEEEIMREFAKEQALRERTAPERAGDEESAIGSGVGAPGSALPAGSSITAPQANITAPGASYPSGTVLDATGKPISSDQLQEDALKDVSNDEIAQKVEELKSAKTNLEDEYAKTAPVSEGGITISSYGRTDAQGNYKSNRLAVGFDKLKQQLEADYAAMGKELPGELKSLGDPDKEGLNLHGAQVEPVREAMMNMLASQYDAFENANSSDDKLTALKLSGKDIKGRQKGESEKAFEERLSRDFERAKEQIGNAIVHLSDSDLVRQEGLELINKNRKVVGERKSAKGVLRHESEHTNLRKLDSDGSGRQRVTDAVNSDENTALRRRMHEHLKGRKDYAGSADYMDAHSVEEYMADIAAGRIKDSDMERVKKRHFVSDETAQANDDKLSKYLYKKRKDRKTADRLMQEVRKAEKSGDALGLADAVRRLQEFYAGKVNEIGTKKEFGINPETGKTFSAKELFDQSTTGRAIGDLAHTLGMGDIVSYETGRKNIEQRYNEGIAKQEEIIHTPPAFVKYAQKKEMYKAKKKLSTLQSERKHALDEYDNKHINESGSVSYLNQVRDTKKKYAEKRGALEKNRKQLTPQEYEKQKALLVVQERNEINKINPSKSAKLRSAVETISSREKTQNVVKHVDERVASHTRRLVDRREATAEIQNAPSVRKLNQQKQQINIPDIGADVREAIRDGFSQAVKDMPAIPRDIEGLRKLMPDSQGGIFERGPLVRLLKGVNAMVKATGNLDRHQRNSMGALNNSIKHLRDNVPQDPGKATDLEIMATMNNPETRKHMETLLKSS